MGAGALYKLTAIAIIIITTIIVIAIIPSSSVIPVALAADPCRCSDGDCRLLSAGRVEDMDSMECAQPEALAAGCRLLRFRHTVHDAATLMKVALNHQ